MFQVVKRDGEVTEFNLGKINDAIAKAFDATQMAYNDDIIGLLSLRVSAHFQNKIEDGMISVEKIQDSVETVLEQTGYTDVAKAYILYRKQREKMRNMKSTILDYKDVINELISQNLLYLDTENNRLIATYEGFMLLDTIILKFI